MVPPRTSYHRRRYCKLVGLLLATTTMTTTTTAVAASSSSSSLNKARRIKNRTRIVVSKEGHHYASTAGVGATAAADDEDDETRELKKWDFPPTYTPTITWKKKPKKTWPPTYFPTGSFPPTPSPTASSPPTPVPTLKPTKKPTRKPTRRPTRRPTRDPSSDIVDTNFPTESPSDGPTENPTDAPSKSPSKTPTISPSYSPTSSPSVSIQPTSSPTDTPSTSQQPTSSPTDTPSTSPSTLPTLVPSASPTTSAMPSMAPIPYSRSTRVDLRYEPWSRLPAETRTLVSTRLNYDENSWNAYSTNPVEERDWSNLEPLEKDAARRLGYDQYSWDCWQNHFQSYRWIDLALPYIQVKQWWEALGWDIYSWNQYIDAPSSDDLGWYELSVEERDAASQLCYFREVWDMGYDNGLVDGFPIERPEFRYEQWMALDGEGDRSVASEVLKYTALTWNVLGLAEIEKRGWGDLTSYETEAASGMGFTQFNWDCWQNHFRSYTWDDLEFYGLDFPYIALGWTSLSWEGTEAPPPSATMSWKELTAAERQVASELCHFRDNWDGLDMTPNYNGDFLYPKVKRRYVEWDEQPTDARRIAADSLSYDRETWNFLGTAPIEGKRWLELTEHQKSDAMSLGFYQRTWDCFLNHYRSYAWVELDRDSRDALQVLGWSENTWERNVEPPSYDNDWSRLSENEQTTAAILCFFEDNWDGNSLEVVSDLVITEDGTVVEEGFIIHVDGGVDGVVGSNSGGTNTGSIDGSDLGGSNSGGSNLGGSNTGGSSASGSSSGGSSGGSSTVGSNEGGSNTISTANGQTPNVILNQDADIMSVKSIDQANSADTAGVNRMSCIFTFVLSGSIIQFLL